MYGAKLCSVVNFLRSVELHGFTQIGSSLFFYVVYLKVFFSLNLCFNILIQNVGYVEQ